MARLIRPLAGVALAISTSPAVYALVLAWERATRPEPDPGAVIWAEQSAFVSRVTVTAFVTALVATGLVALASRVSEEALRRASVAGAVLGVLGWLASAGMAG